MAESEEKRPINSRSFVAIMAGLTGLTLPFSGLILHAYSHHPQHGGRHEWFSAHLFLGILFTVFSVWHVVLNRRPLLRYLKSGTGSQMPFSREMRLAAILLAATLIAVVIHSYS